MQSISLWIKQENGSKLCYPGIKFYCGQIWTLDRYNRINKIRLMRRAVINKHLDLMGVKSL